MPVLVILPAEERPPEVFTLLLQAQTGGDGQELRPELPDQGHLNPQHGPVEDEEDHALEQGLEQPEEAHTET